MRIIAGAHRGRPILPPPSETTRPITDRVKQSLFDILSPYIDGADVYDIFAGTGSMGLECLSRGAQHVSFFEADRGALTNLRKNIATLKLESQSTIIPGDLFKWFASRTTGYQPVIPDEKHGLAARDTNASRSQINLAFLDPPYRYLREQPARLQTLAKDLAAHVDAEGILIFRHDSADALDLPLFRPADVRTYGSMTLEFLRAEKSG